jgi:phosphate transport system permease protein
VNVWRRVKDRIMLGLAALMGIIILVPVVGMVWLVASQAMPVLSLGLFTQVTVGTGGGLANAIVGTFYVVGLGILIAGPLGIMAGVFVAEVGPGSRFAQFVRFTTDVLAGVPSIVIGYFGYVTMVLGFGWGFSTLAGAIALAIIGIPYVVRSTETALSKVPRGMREASLALGASQTTTIWRVTLREALPGVVTGVLLALSIAIGETAPLLYTAGWSNYMPSLQLTHAPIGYLTYVVWTYINEPFASANALAYAAGLLLLVLIVIVNVVARRLVGRSRLGR